MNSNVENPNKKAGEKRKRQRLNNPRRVTL